MIKRGYFINRRPDSERRRQLSSIKRLQAVKEAASKPFTLLLLQKVEEFHTFSRQVSRK